MSGDSELIDMAKNSAHKALCALLDKRDADGLWRDFELPVGYSDQWVSAVIALAVARAGATLDVWDATDAAARVHDLILNNRRHPAGFGFNGHVDADADSTAAVIQLGHALGRAQDSNDLAFLLTHEQPDGGFATYTYDTQWGASHACVTPAVAACLPDCDLLPRRDRLLAYLRHTRNADGTWPSYWWTSPAYASRFVLKLLRRLRPDPADLAPVTVQARLPMNTPLDRILALDIGVLLFEEPARLAKRLKLVLADEVSGLWPPSYNLRLTEPDSMVNSTVPEGRIFADTFGYFTTALALDTLIDLIEAM